MDVVNTCSDVALANFLVIIKRALQMIQIIGPILCMISLTIFFITLVVNPEDKKVPKKIRNSILALVITFFVPLIVNITMKLLDDNFDVAACWNNAVPNSGEATYIETEGTGSSVITDPSLYAPGEEKSSNEEDNSNGSTESSNSSHASKVIYIGDSRTVQMYAYSSNDWNGANYSSGGVHQSGSDTYIAQSSIGYDWLKSTGIPVAESYFTSGSAVVILMGVNDLQNADNYIDYINQNVSNWTRNGSKIYFVSVNPCNGSYSNLNSKIDSFNSKLKSGLSSKVGFIDTNSYLVSVGYKTTDGLHYEAETYQKIYDYIKSKV